MPSVIRRRSSSTMSANKSKYKSPIPIPLEKHLPNVTRFTVDIPGSATRNIENDEPPPPRWDTWEFRFYAVAFVVVVPLMVWWPMNLSFENHPNYPVYQHKLSPGWLFGRKIDISDPQYRSFRNNIVALILLASIYLACSAVHSRFSPSSRSRAIFIAAFSTLMLFLLHGIAILKIFAILSLNYFASTMTKPPHVEKYWPGILFVGNMVMLFMNERYDGYHFGPLHAMFDSLWITEYSGLMPRWHVSFNITMMRMVSFGLDHHWRTAEPVEPPADYRKRVSQSLPQEEYSYINYVAYCLYPPLYIAGPIITFNDFIWQLRNPVVITRQAKRSYAVRFLFCLLTMESVLHTMYVVAIKDTSAWAGDSPAELSLIGFWNLVVVWLKLLIPWRFFRLWALLDGLDPPENMIRCIINNYSTLGFWRSWHRSFNLWTIRYIYIPVGGSKNIIPATLLVFTFVALWHDLSFKLLAWGWLISLFIIPEIVAKRVVPFEKYGHTYWYRHVAAAGGVINVWLMMAANLIGFVLGIDGMKHFVWELTSTRAGLGFMAFAFVVIFISTQVLFEYREEERRQGIDRRC
ncbi:membrane-bound O-acyltransferase GUP1 2, partial [Tremellales sp. Uapishka_1]